MAKVRDTIWEMVKRKGEVDGEFLHNAARIAFIDCGACRRCSMYCPFGIDISYLIMTVRRIMNLLGVVPQYLQDTTNSHSATMNQMWVQQDDWIDTLMWQEEDAQVELAGTRIPLDKEGADIMYSVIGPEPKILAQLIANMAIIFKVAGADWTMPSQDGWDNSNMAMYSGDFETMGRVERLHWDRASELKVKRVVMGECGHAYRGAVYDGPRWLGWTKPPIPMVHAVEYYYELIKSGRIKIARKIEEPVTVQDPCNIVRGPRAPRQAALRRQCPLRGLPRHGSPLRAQLLLPGGRRTHQLRAAVEAVADEEQSSQGRPDSRHRRPHGDHSLPQLPLGHRGHHRSLQARLSRVVHQRDARQNHGNAGSMRGW